MTVENETRQGPDAVVGFDEQNGSRLRGSGNGINGLFVGRVRSGSGWKEDTEFGAAVDFSDKFNGTVVLLYDAMDTGQAQPQAFASVSGGIERFEKMRLNLRGHAATCIEDGKANKLARRTLEFAGAMNLGEADGSREGEFAARSHGTADIEA